MLNFPYPLTDACNNVIMHSGKAMSQHDCYMTCSIKTELSPEMCVAP